MRDVMDHVHPTTPTARNAPRRPFVHRGFAWIASVAIAHAPAFVGVAALMQKGAVPMALVESSSPARIPIVNASAYVMSKAYVLRVRRARIAKKPPNALRDSASMAYVVPRVLVRQ